MTIPCTITPQSINIFFEGRMRTVSATHMNFDKVRKVLVAVNNLETASESRFTGISRMIYGSRQDRIDKQLSKLRLLLDVPAYVTLISEGMVCVTDRGVMFGDNYVHNTLAERIVEHMRRGLDVKPLVKFMNKVMQNPRDDIADELFEWMEAAKLPITEEGNMVAFKKVARDYSSMHVGPEGKIFNRVGAVVRMDWEAVDKDRNRTCSSGLHFCGYDYLSMYGWGGESRVVVVEVNPAHVGAIPIDYNAQKGRCCEYKVIGEVPDEEAQDFFTGKPLITGGTVDTNAVFDIPSTSHTYDIYGDWVDEDEDLHEEDDFSVYDAERESEESLKERLEKLYYQQEELLRKIDNRH
jgi:hypothetical protein